MQIKVKVTLGLSEAKYSKDCLYFLKSIRIACYKLKHKEHYCLVVHIVYYHFYNYKNIFNQFIEDYTSNFWARVELLK